MSQVSATANTEPELPSLLLRGCQLISKEAEKLYVPSCSELGSLTIQLVKGFSLYLTRQEALQRLCLAGFLSLGSDSSRHWQLAGGSASMVTAVSSAQV